MNAINSHFTPLTTFQGLPEDKLHGIIQKRNVVVWGAGFLGKIITGVLSKQGIKVTNCCDANPVLAGNTVYGLKVIGVDEAIEATRLGQAFLIVAVSGHLGTIERQCQDRSLEKNKHYLTYLQIRRPEAVIDVTGQCDLHCPSCVRGNYPGGLSEGHMPYESYKNILDKLLTDIPLLSHIDLSAWGEPLLHPSIHKIIRYTEKKVSCSISTNLQNIDSLEKIIESEPGQFIVSVSGYGETYERHHKGGNWSLLEKNLHILSVLIAKHNPETEFRIKYHMYKDNQGDSLARLRQLGTKLGLKVVESEAYLDPYEHFMEYATGNVLPTPAELTLSALNWNPDLAIELAQQDADKPCLCQRVFPVIHWDLSVGICHLYYSQRIADNYLDIDFKELLQTRHTEAFCRQCQSLGLHRLDIDVLSKRHPKVDFRTL